MHRFRKAIITGFFGVALLGAGQSQAFSFGDSSFSFGDDDWGGWGPGWNDPYRGYNRGYNRGYRGYPGRNWRGPGWNRGYGPSFSNPWDRDRRYLPGYRNYGYNPRMTPPPPPPNAPGGCPAEPAPSN